MNNNDAAQMLPYPPPTFPRLLRIVSTGEIVRCMGFTPSEFVDPKQTVKVRSLKRETFEVLYRDTERATDDEFLKFCQKWPECDWDFPKES
jgi:hypothetical protein